MTKSSLIQALLDDKIITQSQLNHALDIQIQTKQRLEKILSDEGIVEERVLLQYVAQQLQIPLIELAHYTINNNVTKKLAENHARHYQAILLEEDTTSCLIGMVNPSDIFALDELAELLHKSIRIALVSPKELSQTLDAIYRRETDIRKLAEELDIELQTNAALGEDVAIKQAENSISRLIYSMFEDAVQVNASDIHIEPTEKTLRIRLRVDGQLQEQIISTAEKSIATAISQKLKLLANLNIAEKRLPQDGGFNIKVRNMNIDVRLSTMPVQFGESIVMRLLNQSLNILDLDATGMPTDMLRRFRELIKLPRGIILVTGPTGSGKTTTLYGALVEINDIAKNIITIEDPVEYRINGLNQVQVNPPLGLDFAKVLRASLRQDPNVILVGEIRDKETASIALRSALTGHLVLATLHTNDAASTAIRLIDIGVEGYLVASTIRAILAQRLVRKICTQCITAYQPSQHEQMFLASLTGNGGKNLHLKYGAGCNNCNHTGYKGRIGVYELLEFDADTLDALRRNDTHEFVKLVTQNRKTPTLLANALSIANEGITTLSEVMRVAGEW